MRSAQEANRRYFREAYRSGEHGWGVEEPDPCALRLLDRLAALVPGGSLLDLGCGEGRHAIAAAARGLRVTAVDYEPLALRRARRQARKAGARRVRFLQANVLALAFRPGTFDIVLDYGCLHHQRKADWPAYRRSVLRVLKPQGYFILSVFSPRFRLFRGARRPWHIAFGAYRRCFTRSEVAGLFRRDFTILALEEERGEGGGFWHALLRNTYYVPSPSDAGVYQARSKIEA